MPAPAMTTATGARIGADLSAGAYVGRGHRGNRPGLADHPREIADPEQLFGIHRFAMATREIPPFPLGKRSRDGTSHVSPKR